MMSTGTVDTLVVGAGQAGIAMSEHLGTHGIDHLVLERHRIAERWRSERWDSLVMNGPAWHDRFPGMEFTSDPDGFPGKEDVAAYFAAYADRIGAPVRCGVEVIEAANIVAATGPFQKPVIPPLVPADAPVMQIHSTGYRNPAQLPDGAVLVVGAGSSGSQIADELLRAGRRVYLSVGPHDRPPRGYRGRDFCWWLGVLGKWDIAAPSPGTEHVTIAVSGAEGGKTIDFRRFAERGMTLVGRTERCTDGSLHFADDLAANIAHGDANYLSVLEEADAYIDRYGLDLPPEPKAKIIGPDPTCLTHPLRSLDLADAGIASIIWATGFVPDYGWLKADVFDPHGRPQHTRGVTTEPGLYFLGLPWQSRRGSAFIWGVWHDARYVADQIAKSRAYTHHHDTRPPIMQAHP
jgi:putative flavoprotein involved in K+ transport